MYVGRYAPSPTGDLHLGNARTALIAWLWARRAGGRFLLRFEDLDTATRAARMRGRAGRSLAWLGLDWDGEPVAQSARIEHYERGARVAAGAGVLYECFCSRADVRRAASAPHGPDGPLYTGALPRPDRERARRRAARSARQPSLRVRMEGTVEFRDDLAGPQRETLEDTSGRHRPAAQRRRRRLPARGRRRRRGPGRHARRARGRSARLDGSSAPALRAARAGARPGLRARPAAARRRRRAAREAPRRRRARGAARAGRRPARRSSAGSRTAPGCSSAPEPCAPGELVERFDPAALRARAGARRSRRTCAGSLAAC